MMLRRTLASGLVISGLALPLQQAAAAEAVALLCPEKQGLQPLGKDYNGGKAALDKYGLLIAPLAFMMQFNDYMISDSLAAKPKGTTSFQVTGADGKPESDAVIAVLYKETGRFLAQLPADGKSVTLPVGDYLFSAVTRGAAPSWGGQILTLKAGKNPPIKLQTAHAIATEKPAALQKPLPAGSNVSLDLFSRKLPEANIILLRSGEIISEQRVEDWPVSVSLPTTPGAYEMQIMPCAPVVSVVSWPIEVTAPNIRLTAADKIAAGASFDVSWAGDGAPADQIGIRKKQPDATVRGALTLDAKTGTHAKFVAPLEAGDYEITYLAAKGQAVLATHPLKVTAAPLLVTAPERIEAGQRRSFMWPQGPGNDAELSLWSGADVAARKLATIDKPGENNLLVDPGKYQLRLMDGDKVLWSHALDVTPNRQLASGPWKTPPGGRMTIEKGSDFRLMDNLAIVPAGAVDVAVNTLSLGDSNGNSVQLLIPDLPGKYEVVYQTDGGGSNKRVVARAALDVTAPDGSVPLFTLPDTAEPMQRVTLSWPDTDKAHLEIWRVEAGKPARLVRTAKHAAVTALALNAGHYEFRLRSLSTEELAENAPSDDGEDASATPRVKITAAATAKVLVTKPFTVTAAKVLTDVPASVRPGDKVPYAIIGKSAFFDEIYVVKAGTKDPLHDHIGGSNKADRFDVEAPGEPGRYELVYVAGFEHEFADMVLDRVPFAVKN